MGPRKWSAPSTSVGTSSFGKFPVRETIYERLVGRTTSSDRVSLALRVLQGPQVREVLKDGGDPPERVAEPVKTVSTVPDPVDFVCLLTCTLVLLGVTTFDRLPYRVVASLFPKLFAKTFATYY